MHRYISAGIQSRHAAFAPMKSGIAFDGSKPAAAKVFARASISWEDSILLRIALPRRLINEINEGPKRDERNCAEPSL